jgi:hypothetical protein
MIVRLDAMIYGHNKWFEIAPPYVMFDCDAHIFA